MLTDTRTGPSLPQWLHDRYFVYLNKLFIFKFIDHQVSHVLTFACYISQYSHEISELNVCLHPVCSVLRVSGHKLIEASQDFLFILTMCETISSHRHGSFNSACFCNARNIHTWFQIWYSYRFHPGHSFSLWINRDFPATCTVICLYLGPYPASPTKSMLLCLWGVFCETGQCKAMHTNAV